ncbi:MAG: PhzF family phenazine biosynthesis protein [Rhodococcus sp.]|nr:PhzF family phenazine biosynthesis protein [Rhodococcus sp. (in: high G+C Gram-positive bacteria)]
MAVKVDVVRVFTDREGHHGNPLGVVDAAAVPVDDRQALAKELGYSETVFVELPEAGDERARLQIYTPVRELPFAGHPTVGTAWWLEQRGTPVKVLAAAAGDIATRKSGEAWWVRARAEWAPEFSLYPLDTVEEVMASDPEKFGEGHHYVWSWVDKLEHSVRTRMFAPDLGIVEDEATGAAAVRLTENLRLSLLITQGKGSQLRTTYDPDGWIEVGGLVRSEDSRQI